MKADAVDFDADGLPLFHPDPAVARQRIDLAIALRLEQEAQTLDGLEASLMAWSAQEAQLKS